MTSAEGLGEAMELPLKLRNVRAHSHIVDANGREIFHFFRPADADKEFLGEAVSAVNNYSALKQRVKVLEEALGKIAATTDDEARRDPENLVLIAREVIDPNCGNCGDDGEEPSNDCPKCHGTGFRREALNEGGTR